MQQPILFPIQKQTTLKRFVAFIPAILWFILIYVLLTLPGNDLPQVGLFEEIPYFDKYIHTGLFAMLVILFCFPFRKNLSYKSGWYFFIAILALAYGIAMEYVQKYWVVGRSFDIYDIMADGTGSFLGYFVFRAYAKKLAEKITAQI